MVGVRDLGAVHLRLAGLVQLLDLSVQLLLQGHTKGARFLMSEAQGHTKGGRFLMSEVTLQR